MRTFSLRTRKLWRVARQTQYWSALRKGVLAGVEHEAVSLPLNMRSVVDVGASRGQYAVVARNLFPDARIICFEPLAEAREVLERVVPKAEIFPVALGEHTEESAFHVAARDDSSSLLPIGDRQKSIFTNTHEVGRRQVPVRRLDDLNLDLDPPALLKIDTQGSEFQVLNGASASLASVDWVYVETSFVELYVGQHLAPDVIAFLRAHSFDLLGVFNPTYVDGACIQADLLFKRSDRAQSD